MELVIDYSNILLATVLMAFVSLVWRLGLFGKEWMKETGYSLNVLKEHKVEVVRALLFFVLLAFIMALVIALLIGLTHPQGPSGVFVLALMIIGGFIILPQFERVLLEKRSWKDSMISLGQYGLMIITGAYAITYLG